MGPFGRKSSFRFRRLFYGNHHLMIDEVPFKGAPVRPRAGAPVTRGGPGSLDLFPRIVGHRHVPLVESTGA